MNDDLGWYPHAELRTSISLVTSDPAACIPQSDLIFLAGLPIHHNPEVLRKIAPHMDMAKKVFVGSICAYGGFNWVAAEALGPGAYSLFGTQLIPWCCGTKVYGKTGAVFGAKRLLRIATESGTDADGVKPILAKILKMPFLTDTDFLASSLWPNNPSLHPPILYGLFEHWDGARRAARNSRRAILARAIRALVDAATPSPQASRLRPEDAPDAIYADLRTNSAKYLAGEDAELVAIVKALRKSLPKNAHLQSDFSLHHCVNENYEEQITCAYDGTRLGPRTPRAADHAPRAPPHYRYDCVTSVLTNKAFSQHKIPYTKVDGGVVPTLKHKFFEARLRRARTPRTARTPQAPPTPRAPPATDRPAVRAVHLRRHRADGRRRDAAHRPDDSVEPEAHRQGVHHRLGQDRRRRRRRVRAAVGLRPHRRDARVWQPRRREPGGEEGEEVTCPWTVWNWEECPPRFAVMNTVLYFERSAVLRPSSLPDRSDGPLCR